MLKGLLSRLSVMATPVLFFLPLWKLRGRVSKYRGCAIAYSLREQLGGVLSRDWPQAAGHSCFSTWLSGNIHQWISFDW